ncbi:MAG: PRC-barrel domain-containing protein [Myxococcota bacterium]|nr:PRC-barrel domain-containing protein [Myxococcota bacterium]
MNTLRKCQGRSVVSLKEGANVGRLDDFQFDLESRRIYGYRIKESGVFGKAGGVRAELLTRIGRDVGFVDSEDSVSWSGGGRNAEEGRAWASQYKGTRVMSRGGRMMGQVHDLVFDEEEDRVLAIFLDERRWIHLEDGDVATGPAAVIVGAPDALQELPEDLAAKGDSWSWLKSALGGKKAEAEPPESEN